MNLSFYCLLVNFVGYDVRYIPKFNDFVLTLWYSEMWRSAFWQRGEFRSNLLPSVAAGSARNIDTHQSDFMEYTISTFVSAKITKYIYDRLVDYFTTYRVCLSSNKMWQMIVGKRVVAYFKIQSVNFLKALLKIIQKPQGRWARPNPGIELGNLRMRCDTLPHCQSDMHSTYTVKNLKQNIPVCRFLLKRHFTWVYTTASSLCFSECPRD
jgi:hypothetical protein